MGIWATLLDENDEQFSQWNSKAVFVFCAEAIVSYCHRAELTREEREDASEILDWFTSIAKEMSESLCMLNLATEPPWEYEEHEYSRYLSDAEKWPGAYLLSPVEFLERCREQDDPYMEPIQMALIVKDLLQTLKTLRPRETWWYKEEDT